MAKNSWLEVKLKQQPTDSTHRVMESLACHGWSIYNSGIVEHLALGEVDFEWKSLQLSERQVRDLIREKQRLGENVGFLFRNSKENVGVHMVFRDLNEVDIGLSRFTRTLGGEWKIADITWYLRELICSVWTPDQIVAISWTEA